MKRAILLNRFRQVGRLARLGFHDLAVVKRPGTDSSHIDLPSVSIPEDVAPELEQVWFLDPEGNPFVYDYNNHRFLRIDLATGERCIFDVGGPLDDVCLGPGNGLTLVSFLGFAQFDERGVLVHSSMDGDTFYEPPPGEGRFWDGAQYLTSNSTSFACAGHRVGHRFDIYSYDGRHLRTVGPKVDVDPETAEVLGESTADLAPSPAILDEVGRLWIRNPYFIVFEPTGNIDVVEIPREFWIFLIQSGPRDWGVDSRGRVWLGGESDTHEYLVFGFEGISR